MHLKIDQEVENYGGSPNYFLSTCFSDSVEDSLSHAYLIESINVVDFSGTESETSFHRLQDVQLDVQAYELHESEEDSLPRTRSIHHEGEDEDAIPQVRVTALPSKSLNGVWES